MKPKFCQYCGTALSDGCDCARELAEYNAAVIEEIEERQHASGFYSFQDMLEVMRYER